MLLQEKKRNISNFLEELQKKQLYLFLKIIVNSAEKF
jgi:hypothetical protein